MLFVSHEKKTANLSAKLHAGDHIRIIGRFQSRGYTKKNYQKIKLNHALHMKFPSDIWIYVQKKQISKIF